jgi:hypothetical protein
MFLQQVLPAISKVSKNIYEPNETAVQKILIIIIKIKMYPKIVLNMHTKTMTHYKQ